MKIMGILNVTPDSFSDGGDFSDVERAVNHGLKLADSGADIIDIGGESTRPGADPVSAEEELKRVIPVIEGLVSTGVPISIDTQKSVVARAAFAAGATILNDVSALESDPDMLATAAELSGDVVLMHMHGSPKTMQETFSYESVVDEVFAGLLARTKRAVNGGVRADRIVVDPGIGFGKSTEHNVALLNQIARFHDLGFRVLVGASRKRFLGQITGTENASERDPASIAVSIWCAKQEVDIVRVHDVAGTRQALTTWRALQ